MSCGFDSFNKTDEFLNTSKVEVENVKIKEDIAFGWAVGGMIRNESTSDLIGYVKIKFLISKGDILKTAKSKS